MNSGLNNHRFLPKAGLTAYDGMRKVMNTTTIYDSKRVEASKQQSKDDEDDDGDYDEEADDIYSTDARADPDDKESIDSTKQRLTLYKTNQIHSSQVQDILIKRNLA